MIDEELLNKFDRIQDLPVSEEMLGAYMEDNLDSTENSQIESLLSMDSHLSELLENISHESIGNILDNIGQQLFDPSYPVFISDIELPDPNSEYLSQGFYNENMVAACFQGDSFVDIDSLSSDDMLTADSNSTENLSQDDSFIGTDQSLDIESHLGDDMFYEDSIDI